MSITSTVIDGADTRFIEAADVLVRATLSVIAGLVVWVLLVTLAGFVMRAAWPSYAAVADAMTFTLPMMIVRLAIGAVATIATGLTASAIARQSMVPPLAAGILLLLAFIPQRAGRSPPRSPSTS